MEWYNRNDKNCYVSFSGGKDSTVLADITAQVCSLFNCKIVLWFSDTGLEYPEVREHVKKFPQYLQNKYNIEVELVMDYPKDRNGKRITFRDVILNKGYPIITKEISRDVGVAQNNPDGKTAQKFIKEKDLIITKSMVILGYWINGHILLKLHFAYLISVATL